MKHDPAKHKAQMRLRKHRRIRGTISGTPLRPRLNVFRSAKHVLLQLIDDEAGRTLVHCSSAEFKGVKDKITKTEAAKKAGTQLAELAKKKHISRALFDRGGYAYHGRVRAAAEGAREGGLEF